MRSAHGWLFGAMLAACTPPPVEPAIRLTPCRLEGLGVEARCGEHVVHEQRELPTSRALNLRVAVVPALAESPEPDPLFILVGGPGQAATEAGAPLAEALRDVRRRRDIVLVDQRGTAGNHALVCERDESRPLAERFAPVLDLETTRRCRAELGADTTRYATPEAVADLDEVRRALGYSRINLWGGSYGTRAALVYARSYPERARSLVLDGLAPTTMRFPLFVPRDAQRALDALYEDCARDPDCGRSFPDARGELDHLFARLEADPLELTLPHPRRGTRETLRIEREGLAMAVLNMLYVPELAGLLPLAVQSANRGEYQSLVAAAEAFTSQLEAAAGMFLSVVCAEGVARFSADEAREETRGTFLGEGWLARLRAECSEWPAAVLPDEYFTPVRSDVPSLLLSGGLDPVTPPRWGEEVARDLSRSRHIVVPAAAHGVSAIGCMPELIADFLDALDPAALDPACVTRLNRPGFFISLAGPTP